MLRKVAQHESETHVSLDADGTSASVSSSAKQLMSPMSPNAVVVHISAALPGSGSFAGPVGMSGPSPSTTAGFSSGAPSVSTTGTSASQPSSTTSKTSSKYADMVGNKNKTMLDALGRAEGLLATLHSDRTQGILSVSVPNRRATYGVNRLPPIDLQTFWGFVKEALEDKTMQVLIGAAVISLILGMTTPDPRTGEVDRTTGWIEGFAILVSIVIVTVVSSLNNFQKQEQFAQLMEVGNRLHAVTVLRDGTWQEVADDDVVVGDLVQVSMGMQLSFDAVMLSGDDIVCDETSITGERGEVHKDAADDPFFISGTNVIDGVDAIAVVVAVGESSFAGAIAMAVRDGKKNTPLQEQLEEMAEVIGKFGLAAAIFTFGVLLLKELYVMLFLQGKFFAMKLFENITTAVAIVVVAVPEGLPLSVTISLAYSMKRMLQDGNLVRHLAACETMGGATVLCSDKTGTLTQSNMKVASIHLEGKTATPPSLSFTGPDTSSQLSDYGISESGIKLLLDALALTTGGASHTHGNKTSEALVALISGCQRLGPQATSPYDANVVVQRLDHQSARRFAFSSIRKQSSIVVRSGDKLQHFVCGAAELVLQQCNMYMGPNGQRLPLTVEMRRHHDGVITDFTRGRGLRTLSVAFSERPSSGFAELPSQPPPDVLTLIGIVGLEEPIRADVPDAIRSCRRAGMSVVMLTGDNLSTAVSIAQRCGMLSEQSVTMDGPTFRSLSDDEVCKDVLPNLAVLARATPLDKQRVVTLFKRDACHVVAVTGDGTNDAPALKAADVGFSMNSGSDVAKRASDIVLLHDNFVGMVKAAMWGRNVRDNIRKFLQFQLTVNLAACVVAFCGAVMNNQNLSPLKPVQLLWLNLIMDTLAALALATELPCEQKLLSRAPEPKDAPIITRTMWTQISVQSGFQLLVQLFLLAHTHRTFSLSFFGPEHLTIVFNVFVWLQVFNFFNARLLLADARLTDNLHESQALLTIVAVIAVTQVLLVEFGGKFVSTVPLTANQWCYSIAVGSLSLASGTWARSLARRRDNGGALLSSLAQWRWWNFVQRKVNSALKKS